MPYSPAAPFIATLQGRPHYRLAWSAYLLAIVFILGISGKTAAGQWQLEKHDEQYRISIQSGEEDRLALFHEGETTRFILLTAAGQDQPDARLMLQLRFDDESGVIETGLGRLGEHAYLIKLSESQKSNIINRMINRLKLQIRYPVGGHDYRKIDFSLLGFTAVLNDLLIAHEIGHLDPEWLNENHKTQELMCYYAANFSVLAMMHRKQGLAYKQSVNKLTRQYTNVLVEVISDIVKQVYDLPRTRLPRDPRGDKFGIFQRCMQNFRNNA